MLQVDDLQVIPTLFPDNTSQVWKLPEQVFENSYPTIVWEYEHEGELIQLCQLVKLLRKENPDAQIDLHVPYLPYARQDKRVSNGTTFSLEVFAAIINSLSFRSVRTLDVHSRKATELIKSLVNEFPTAEFLAAHEENNSDLLVFPDKGAADRYRYEYKIDAIMAVKERDQMTGEIKAMRLLDAHKVNGRNAMMVDDICDGGRTFIELAKLLKAAGAISIDLFVTHGIFSKGMKVLYDAGIRHITAARLFRRDQ